MTRARPWPGTVAAVVVCKQGTLTLLGHLVSPRNICVFHCSMWIIMIQFRHLSTEPSNRFGRNLTRISTKEVNYSASKSTVRIKANRPEKHKQLKHGWGCDFCAPEFLPSLCFRADPFTKLAALATDWPRIFRFLLKLAEPLLNGIWQILARSK